MPSRREQNAAVKYNDYPLTDLARTIAKANREGGTAFFKFTCDYCHSRQTVDVPNVLFEEVTCEDCKSVTNTARKGGNLMLVFTIATKVEKP